MAHKAMLEAAGEQELLDAVDRELNKSQPGKGKKRRRPK